MIKLSSNIITLACCIGQKDIQMENAINLGVPVLGTLLGKSPLYYAQLKNDFVSINKLVSYLQSKQYY